MLKWVVLVFVSFPLCLLSQNPSGMITPPAESVKDTTGQKDIIRVLLDITHIHIKKPPSVKGRRVYYSLLPVGTNIPGGGTALVTTTQAGFYLGEKEIPTCLT